MIELNNQCQSTQKIARKLMSSVLHSSQDFLWIVETLNMEIRLEHLYTIRQHFVKFQNPTPANLYKKKQQLSVLRLCKMYYNTGLCRI